MAEYLGNDLAKLTPKVSIVSYERFFEPEYRPAAHRRPRPSHGHLPGQDHGLCRMGYREARIKTHSTRGPVGSVFYFHCENAATARDLAVLRHGRPRSDALGEQGIGYGFAAPFPSALCPDMLLLAAGFIRP